MIRRALRFPDQITFRKAVALLDALASEGPLEYDFASDPSDGAAIVVLPQWSFDRVESLFAEHRLRFTDMKVKRMSELAPQEQGRLRGLKWGASGGQVGRGS